MVTNSCFKSYMGCTNKVRSASEACFFLPPPHHCYSVWQGPCSNTTADKWLYAKHTHFTTIFFLEVYHIMSHHINHHLQYKEK